MQFLYCNAVGFVRRKHVFYFFSSMFHEFQYNNWKCFLVCGNKFRKSPAPDCRPSRPPAPWVRAVGSSWFGALCLSCLFIFSKYKPYVSGVVLSQILGKWMGSFYLFCRTFYTSRILGLWYIVLRPYRVDIMIIYKPGARGIRPNISRNDDIIWKYHH